MAGDDRLGPGVRFEVAYAEPDRAIVKEFRVEVPVRVEEALALAAAAEEFAGIDLAASAVGIFGRVAGRDHVLSPGDRLEIYRPLTNDPKVARRTRAREARRRR